MKRNRRSRKKNRFYSALVAMLMVVALAGSTVTTGVAAEISGDADAGGPTAYTAAEVDAESGDASIEEYAEEQDLSAGESDPYDSDAGLDDGELTDGEESGDMDSEEFIETEEDQSEAAASDYEFVAEYQGGAWQVGSEEELSAEDFLVYVYNADGELVDTLEAESVTSDYEVDEDGYILALVVCIFEGETIEVEAQIMAIDTLAAGDTCAFAFYCADDKSLNFYYGEQPAAGDEYGGKTVTTVYTGFDTNTYGSGGAPWYSDRTKFTSVVFDESFFVVKPTAMAYWFYNFTNCTEFIGLEYIDTRSVTTMQDLFRGCSSVTSLDITCWNTSDVTTMAQMFYECKGLTSLKVDNLDVSNVTEMNGMFRYLNSLTEIDLSGWEPSKATTINAFIRDNPKLTTIYTDRDWPLEDINANSKNMFFDDSLLVGGNGTAYNASNVEGSMAYIDRADKAGYFTDSRVLDMVNISGTKVWDDADNQDGIRPGSITVNLYAGEELADSMTVTAEDDWSFTFSDEPKYDENFDEITYTITEDVVEGYTSEITGSVEEGFVITNSYTPKLTDVSGTITWDDGNNQDGKRPTFVSVQLFAKDSEGGTLKTWTFEVHAPETPVYDNEGNEVWTWSMDGLDQYYGGGQGVKYTVICTGVDLDVYEQVNPDDLNVIYSYTPETTTVSGGKTWVDDDNAQNTRPESITIRLHGNNEVVDTQVVTAGEGWAWTFDDLPVYDNGHEIHYTITEDAVDNYVAEYDGYNVTNTLHEGETSVTVLKDWEDENDQDGIRPDSITVNLLADGSQAVDGDGNDVTMSLVDNGEGIWEGTFEVAANSEGRKIVYTIEEPTVTDKNGKTDSYEVVISGDAGEGFTVTNSYTPEMIEAISGEKVWEDADDQDGMRPSSIYVHLMANGTAVDEAEVMADANGDWTFTFTDKPKCANGSEIEYAVEEVLSETAADAYTATYSGDIENGFTITNSHTPEMLNGDGTLTVTKVWDDDDDRDGLRPGSVTVHLLADGVEIDSATLGNDSNGAEPTGLWQSMTSFFSGTQTLAAEVDGWTATFTDLPKYSDGKEIAYTVTEDSVEGYTAAVTGSTSEGYTVTNTHAPATINIKVEKIWDDAEDQDGKRPVSITVNLLADGNPALDENGDAITMVINEDDDWDDPFMNLYKYRDGGTEIVYTIEEDTTDLADIYTTTIEGDMTDGFTITNSYTPELYNGDGTFKVVVVWDDEADNDGIRPSEVNITLVKDNTAVDGATMSLTGEETDENGNWTGTFTDLPKYENGSEIVYSVKEDYKSGYTYRVELLTDDDGKTYVQLTNVHVSVKEDIEVTKVWDDNNNQDGKRPESITVRLLTNGNLYKTVTLTAESDGVTVSENGNVWKYTMKDIPVDKNGVNIEYTMIEVDVEGYVTPEIEVIRGDEITDNGVTYQPYSFEVTNSHTPEQITVSGTKEWDDADNQDGKRPQYVKLNLSADGDVIETIDVSTDDAEGNNENVWDWAFSAHDRYKDGVEIEYTVTEEEVTEYTTEITGSAADGFTVTNSYTPETTAISGSKTWVDEDAAETYRPESITVRLHANGSEKVYEQTVTADDEWTWTFENVPVYSNGHPITYTLTEDAIDDYDVEYGHGDDGTLNVINTIDPGNTSVTVEKDWEDAENQDGIRPESVTVELLANNEETGETLTLSEGNYWEDTFHHLEEYDSNGARIAYTVKEVSVDGYTCDISGNATAGYTITNTHTPATIDISGSKVWKDNDDQDGIRPDHITIHLMNGEETLESHTVNAENDWTFTFSGLDKYASGEEISYTIEEAYTAEGYEAAVDGYTITNTHTPEKINITGTKTWDDDNDRDGIRPTSITISLLAGDETVASQTVTEADNWNYTFTDLDKCANGEEIAYSISEEVPDGYHASYNHFDYDMTNTHSPELFNDDGTLSVIMHWDDEEDQDGLRPKRTTITLMLNDVPDETITLVLSDDNMDENGNWIGTFTGLYKYADGEEIAYNVEEGVMNGYTYTAELLYDEDTGLYYIEITNTHAAVTSDITVTKVWDDNDNQDGIRSDSVVVNLFSNGSAVKSVTLTPGKEGVEVSDDGNEWSYTFENMPVDQNGEAIIYTLDEVDVGSYSHSIDTAKTEKVIDYDGYEFSYTQYDFTVTNSHTPETTVVSGEKIWEDADDQDGIRPNSITIELLADGVPALDENGEEITQLVTPHTDGSWTWNFTDIPKYRDGGVEIVYSFEEFSVEGYETSYSADGLTVTNTYEPETRDISGNKVWEDGNNQDGNRPKEIKVSLYANGLVYDTKTVTEADGWAWTFENLPVNANGNHITYVTTEVAIDDYDTTYSGFTLTNTYEPDKTSVTVIADWEDEEDQDGIRPNSITIELLADGVPALDGDGNAITLTLTEDENGIWEGTFEHLNENRDSGTRIEYSIGEIAVEGYECVIEGDASEGYSLVFTHTPETIDLSVSKIWDDADDQDGIRPDSISVHLLADGEEVLTEDIAPVEATPARRVAAIMTLGTLASMEDDWSFEFTNLPKYANGQEITYTISETAVTGYGTSITGDAESGFEIKNTHIPETVTVSGTKVWHDGSDQDGLRPDSITLNLQADGKDAQSLEVEGNGDTWEWAFTDLPKYAAGEEIEYAVEEIAVDAYDTAMSGSAADGYTIINTHTPEVLTISGKKTWDDEDNQDGFRPGSITIRLHKNGEVVATRTVTAYDGWSWTFSNEPKYENGLEIAYTITEDAIDEYSASVDGYDVTNSYTPGQTSLTVVKDWEDANDQDGKRPQEITVNLLADGNATDKTLTLSDENGWEGTFTELDEYSEGNRIAYTVEELSVDDYDSEITGGETEGYVITNTHEPETIDIDVNKVWDDAEDQDGKRPDGITVSLLNQNDKTVATQSVTEEDDWAWTFTLDKYADGEEIDYSAYSVKETAVADYTTDISGSAADGFEITNTHEPEQINGETHVLAVTLRWNDDDNTDGLRPSSVTLTLMANGEAVTYENGEPVTLTLDESNADADGNWVGEFNLNGIDLYRYKDGFEISYSVDETDDKDRSLTTDGYTSRTSLAYNEETGIWSLEVTNSHTTVTQNITVTKVWDDDNNRDGKRPESIEIHLKANGGTISGGDVTLTKDNVEVSEGGNKWTYVFEEMPVDENGEAIEYTLTEDTPKDYNSKVNPERGDEITESGVTYEPYSFTITNSHEIETIDLSGTIVWNDDDNKDGKRPDSVTVHLYADGKEIDKLVVTAGDDWSWIFANLPKYRDGGIEIVYTVKEDPIEGYTEQVVDGDTVIINTLTSDQSGTGGKGGTGGTGDKPKGTVTNNGGNGNQPTQIRGGRTNDTNVLPITLIIIMIAVAAIIVILVVRVTGRRNRRSM